MAEITKATNLQQAAVKLADAKETFRVAYGDQALRDLEQLIADDASFRWWMFWRWWDRR
jgi:hypothetical protein